MVHVPLKLGYRYGSRQAREAVDRAKSISYSKHASALYTLFDSLCCLPPTYGYALSGGLVTDEPLSLYIFPRSGVAAINRDISKTAITPFTQLLNECGIAYALGEPQHDGSTSIRIAEPFAERQKKLITLMDKYQEKIMAAHEGIDFVLTKPDGSALSAAQEQESHAIFLAAAEEFWAPKTPVPPFRGMSHDSEAGLMFIMNVNRLYHAVLDNSEEESPPPINQHPAYMALLRACIPILNPHYKQPELAEILYREAKKTSIALIDQFCATVEQVSAQNNKTPGMHIHNAAFYEAFAQLSRGLPQSYVACNWLNDQLAVLREVDANRTPSDILTDTKHLGGLAYDPSASISH